MKRTDLDLAAALSAAAMALGTLGGRSRSQAKTAAARENGAKGGRPATLPPIRYRCPRCRKQLTASPSRAPFCPTRHRPGPVRMRKAVAA